MRSVLALAIVMLAASMASARPGHKWGGYISESFGGTAYKGDFDGGGDGGFRLQVGVGVVQGPWAAELVIGGIIGTAAFGSDCFDDPCSSSSDGSPSMLLYGVELRRAWPLVKSRYSWLNLDLVLHGGPHVIEPEYGRSAGSLAGGAAIDLNVTVISMFLDFSTDFVIVDHDDGAGLGSLPTIQLGMRFGWM